MSKGGVGAEIILSAVMEGGGSGNKVRTSPRTILFCNNWFHREKNLSLKALNWLLKTSIVTSICLFEIPCTTGPVVKYETQTSIIGHGCFSNIYNLDRSADHFALSSTY